jgi:hypothetical protein
MPAAVPRSRHLPSHGTATERSCESPSRRRCPGWPAGAVAARFHRCAKTPARPLLVPLSRDESRPRAPLRLLQVDVSTSTTTDHPNISIREIRGRDDCLGSIGSRLPFEAAAGGAQGQGSGTRCPTFPVAIARAGDLAPTPIAPSTWCRRTSSPTGLERRGEVVTLPTSSALARSARRKGGVAPALREEAQR